MTKHVLKYIKGSLDYYLKFCRNNNLTLLGFCDSDYGSSENRCSITGYFCYQLNKFGTLISWKCKKQSVFALSSCEAEYMAITYAIQEGKFLRQLISDMKCIEKVSFLLFVD